MDLNLNNVTFPMHSEVTLRSRDGTLNTGSTAFSNPVLGSVNMTNVKHLKIGDVALDKATHFNGVPGKYASSVTQPNGTPAIQIKKF